MAAAPAWTSARIAFRVLGPLTVVRDGAEIAIAGARQRALLSYLLLHANRVVATERLVDELFGDEPPDSALNSVHTGISRLRRQLQGSGADGTTIVTRPPGYIVELERGQLDLHVFEDLLQAGRRQLDAGKPEEARKTLGEALELWRGEPFSGLSAYAFARDEGARLEDMRLAAVLERIEADLALGRHAEVIGELERLQAKHPFQERLRAQLMLALYRSGRQADALQAYQDTRRALASELGLEPGKPLQQLERAILNHDPALELPENVHRATVSLPGAPRSRRTRWALVAASAFLLVAGAAAAAAVLLATRTGSPLSVAPSSVVAIDPETNRVVAAVPVGAGPTRVLATASGVWVLNQHAQTVSLIDPKTREPVRTFSVGATPSGLAVDRHGLWVASPDGHVALVDLQTQTVVRRFKVRVWPKVLPNDSRLVGHVVSGFGSLWVVSGGRTLTRINVATRSSPSTNLGLGATRTATTWKVVATIHGVTTGIGTEGGLAIGDGVVWAANLNELTRIDPSTNTAQPVPLRDLALWHITGLVASGDDLWLGDVGNDRVWEVGGLPPRVIRSVAVGSSPLGLAYGLGSLWVANGGDGTVTRIDPTTGHVVAAITVGGAPVGIAVDSETVWVTVD